MNITKSSARNQAPAELKKMLADWRQSVDAQMPTPNPEPVEPFGPQGVQHKKEPTKRKG